MRLHTSLVLLLLAGAAPFTAQAEGALGGSVAVARLNGSNFADVNGSSAGWKVFAGGYSQILGGELQYIDFGHPGNAGNRLHAFAADVTAGFHFDAFYPYGKVGAAFLDVKHQAVNQEYHATRAFWGVGARFPILPALGLRVEYERFQLSGEHEDLASAGAEFRF